MFVTWLTSHVPMVPLNLGLLLQLVPEHAQLPVADCPTHATTAALRSSLMLLQRDGGPSFVEDAGFRAKVSSHEVARLNMDALAVRAEVLHPVMSLLKLVAT